MSPLLRTLYVKYICLIRRKIDWSMTDFPCPFKIEAVKDMENVLLPVTSKGGRRRRLCLGCYIMTHFFLNLWLKVCSSLSTKKKMKSTVQFLCFLKRKFCSVETTLPVHLCKMCVLYESFCQCNMYSRTPAYILESKTKKFSMYTCRHKHTKVTKASIMSPLILGEVYCFGLVVCLSVTNLCLLCTLPTPGGIFK